MTNETIKDDIAGARSLSNIIITVVLLIAGAGFFLAGISSYLHVNLLKVTDTSTITFIPQGIALLFYGTGAIVVNSQNKPERVGGIDYTIKDGIVYDAKKLLKDVENMVNKAKREDGELKKY